MSDVILVLSERAGRELHGSLHRESLDLHVKLDRWHAGGGPTPADGGRINGDDRVRAATERAAVIDDIVAELDSQLTGSTAVAIAARVALAGASALQPKGN